MKAVARLFLTTVLAALVFLPAHATSSLSFEGDGCLIDLEIGDTGRPVIAALRFHAPGDSQGVPLPSRLYTVQVFDTKRQVLLLSYSGGESGIAAFTLSVHQKSAVLQTGNQRVVSEFDWTM